MRANTLVAIAVATFVASCSSFVGAATAPLDDFASNLKKMDRRLGKDSDVHEERGGDINSAVVDVIEHLRNPLDGLDHLPNSQIQTLNQLADEQLRAKELPNIAGPSNQQPRIQLSTATDEKVNPRNSESLEDLKPLEEEKVKPRGVQFSEDPIFLDEKVKPRDYKVSEDLKPHDEPLPDYKIISKMLTEDEIKILQKSKVDVAKLQDGDADQIRLLLKYAATGSEKERGFFAKVVVYTIYAIGIISFLGVIYLLMTRSSNSRPSPAWTP